MQVYRTTWTVWGEPHGEGRVSQYRSKARAGAVMTPRSQAWLCPCCGELWARMEVDSGQRWYVNQFTRCDRCGNGLLCGGWNTAQSFIGASSLILRRELWLISKLCPSVDEYRRLSRETLGP